MKLNDRDGRSEYDIYLDDARRNECKNPDPNNRDELVRSTLFWVVTLALRFKRKYPACDLMDCIQSGNMGSLHAATKFKPTEKCKFTTYATPWIFVYMARGHLSTKRNIYIPPGKQIKMMKNGDPIPWECSIDETPPINGDETSNGKYGYANLLPDESPNPEESLLREAKINTCVDLIMGLPKREAYVLWSRLIDEERLEDIATRIKPDMNVKWDHISKERVRQIEREALRKVQVAAGIENATGKKMRGRVVG